MENDNDQTDIKKKLFINLQYYHTYYFREWYMLKMRVVIIINISCYKDIYIEEIKAKNNVIKDI